MRIEKKYLQYQMQNTNISHLDNVFEEVPVDCQKGFDNEAIARV